jgi:hypothetical protein
MVFSRRPQRDLLGSGFAGPFFAVEDAMSANATKNAEAELYLRAATFVKLPDMLVQLVD